MASGHRFDFPGHWVYVGGSPRHSPGRWSSGPEIFPQGMINHVAFGVYEFEPAKARIEVDRVARTSSPASPSPASASSSSKVREGFCVEVQYRR